MGNPVAEMKERALCICWGIWKMRNELCWKNKNLSTREVTNMINSLFLQWKSRNQPIVPRSSNCPSEINRSSVWQKPPVQSLKINCDAALFRESN